MESIGNRLKKIRTSKQLTQQGMGDIMGVSKQAVANIESGHNNPSIEFIGKLIENLNVNSNWFIIGQGEMFIPPKFEQAKEELALEIRKILREEGLIK